MASRLSVFVQDTPVRRVALVARTPDKKEKENPLIISLNDATSKVLGLSFCRENQFNAAEWKQMNESYGYLGNVAFSPQEVFIVVILGYEPITALPYPEFTVNGDDSGTFKRGFNAYHITKVGFISLCNNYYDFDTDINPNADIPGPSWHSSEHFDDPEELEDPLFHYSSDDSFESAGFNSTRKKGFTSLANRNSKDNNVSSKLDNLNEDPDNISLPYDSLKKLLNTQYFYFSHTIDLTRSLQSRYLTSSSFSYLPGTSFYPCDTDFLWNYSLLTCQLQYLEQVASKNPDDGMYLFQSGLITPIIQGYMETFHKSLEIKSATVISRVCWKRAGTRFHSRGLDDEGYTANFVETELLISSTSHKFGFVAVRGSVPAFWTQEGNQLLGHKIQMTRGIDATQPSSDRHLEWMKHRYGDIQIINLLSQKEGTVEAALGRRFEQLVSHSRVTPVSFISFDFHALCKKNQYEPAQNLIDQLGNQLQSGGYFLWDFQAKLTISQQKGVFRINCLDCLDRTNVIQGLVFTYVLGKAQTKLGAMSSATSFNYRDPEAPTFKSQLASAISNNGDAISKIYAGTGALQSGVAAGGKASLINRLQDASKSVSRLYLHHFHDQSKQEAIDHLVGRSVVMPKVVLAGYAPVLPVLPPLTSKSLHVSNLSKYHEATTVSCDSLMIHCGTYNVNGRIPSGDSLIPWIQPLQGTKMADIYVLAFEEIVELTPSQILAADLDRAILWETLLLRDLSMLASDFEESSRYVLLTSEQLVGICMFVFVKRHLLPAINQVRKGIKKTGLKGIAGNKGATAIRFRFENTTFCFVACHFASGQTKFEERNKDFHTIHDGLKFPMFGSPDSHDVLVYIGDFNYRINLSNEKVRHLASQGQLGLLLEKDQLLEARQREWVFSGFSEGAITFPPTYKFDVGTDNYDTSEKNRVPAWTDRILYKGSKAHLMYYSLAPLYESDHRPVVAGFKILINNSKENEDFLLSVKNSQEVIPKKLPPPCPPRPGTTSNDVTSPKETDLILENTLPKPSSFDHSWWDIPLTCKPEEFKNLDMTIKSDESEALSELDKLWNPQSISNPFRQPGLRAAINRVKQPISASDLNKDFVPSPETNINSLTPTNLMD